MIKLTLVIAVITAALAISYVITVGFTWLILLLIAKVAINPASVAFAETANAWTVGALVWLVLAVLKQTFTD